MQLPRLIAHRGDKRYAPENTLAAFRQAKAKGATWIEFDATLTKNAADPVVVFHDDTVGRTTDLPNRSLTEVSFAELRAADAGKWFSYSFAGEKVPTLTQTIGLCDQLGLGMNIEIKVTGNGLTDTPEPFDNALAQETARRVVEDVNAARGGNWDNILLSSFSTAALLKVMELAPEAPRGYLLHQLWPEDGYDPNLPELRRHLQLLKPYSVHFNQSLLSSHERYMRLRATITAELGREAPILAYTVNEGARAHMLLDWGVAALFTDAPGDLEMALNQPRNTSGEDYEESL
jgi:glycerophosphoryl diester phosphodiesterase